jgi:DNA repair exonuclease SbcCD ATPase subunit
VAHEEVASRLQNHRRLPQRQHRLRQRHLQRIRQTLHDPRPYGAKCIAVDGTKFKAANSLDKNFNRKNLAYRMKAIDKQVSKCLAEIEEEDRREEQANHKQAEVLQEKIQKLVKRKEEYSELLAKLKESKQNEVSLVDPDCRLMKNRGRIEPCYNRQAPVDDKNHLIVNYNVTNAPADNCQLSSMAIGAKEDAGSKKPRGCC